MGHANTNILQTYAKANDEYRRSAIKPSVLIAESDPTMAKFFVTNLKLLGCEGVVESTPQDAIRRAAVLRPDFAFGLPFYCHLVIVSGWAKHLGKEHA